MNREDLMTKGTPFIDVINCNKVTIHPSNWFGVESKKPFIPLYLTFIDDGGNSSIEHLAHLNISNASDEMKKLKAILSFGMGINHETDDTEPQHIDLIPNYHLDIKMIERSLYQTKRVLMKPTLKAADFDSIAKCVVLTLK